VQGAAAVVEVSAALAELEANPDVDVIIITRGGGSFEDLLPFSDESLIRLAASCTTPIVSAIGHEKDAPLLDLIADYRASTPTDAAKRVVPDIAQEISDIEKIRDRMYRRLVSTIDYELNQIAQLRNRPVMKDPKVMVTVRRDEIKAWRDRSMRSFASILEIEKKELKGVKAHLRSLSPQSTMDRGYAVVQLDNGTIVRDAAKVKAGTSLRIRVAKGETRATVNE
jgi:exodeoxyribonuclease VII large subunit